ncbi:Hypothetical predicted protein [Podarcis lilfordi]|uniref:Uncharacterized protein n=1 Tax=Podarcis lilfordi TaxID=74358 RepID=A0AA35P7X2_9SAUR|nr:Hypothetical predicted protein [Podarcis lilfordi]
MWLLTFMLGSTDPHPLTKQRQGPVKLLNRNGLGNLPGRKTRRRRRITVRLASFVFPWNLTGYVQWSHYLIATQQREGEYGHSNFINITRRLDGGMKNKDAAEKDQRG